MQTVLLAIEELELAVNIMTGVRCEHKMRPHEQQVAALPDMLRCKLLLGCEVSSPEAERLGLWHQIARLLWWCPGHR